MVIRGTRGPQKKRVIDIINTVIRVIYQGIIILYILYVKNCMWKNSFYRTIYIVRVIKIVMRYLNILQSVTRVIVFNFEMTDWKHGLSHPVMIPRKIIQII